jgi:hypothetical protein
MNIFLLNLLLMFVFFKQQIEVMLWLKIASMYEKC